MVHCELTSTSRRARRVAMAAMLSATGLAAIAEASSAATLGLDERCYVAGEKAAVSGSGFAPKGAVTISRAGEQVAAVAADNSGSVRQPLMVPDLPLGTVESQVEVDASDGTASAKAYMNVVQVGASFTPTTGDPKTLQVSHVVSGFGLSEAKPSIYLHYVSPAAQRAASRSTGGQRAAVPSPTPTPTPTATPKPSSRAKATPTPKPTSTPKATPTPKPSTTPKSAPVDPPGVTTIRLGQLRGPCGVLRTSPRRLIPFNAAPGEWVLQYDTRPRYTRGTTSSPFLWSSRKLTIAD